MRKLDKGLDKSACGTGELLSAQRGPGSLGAGPGLPGKESKAAGSFWGRGPLELGATMLFWEELWV